MKLCIRVFIIWFVLQGSQAFSQEQIKPNDLRRERIYSIVLSRFSDGDADNNFFNRENIDAADPHYRGDLKGAASKLGYIKGLGFTSICISPPDENRGALDFSGMFPYDWYKTDYRLVSNDFTYQDFINEVHRNGLKIIQTVVLNHSCNYGIRNRFFIPRLPLK
ncbi:MAG: alpha-amylase family glycosyl hydrolase, partial [Candidatus Riflebacteria bacterium]